MQLRLRERLNYEASPKINGVPESGSTHCSTSDSSFASDVANDDKEQGEISSADSDSSGTDSDDGDKIIPARKEYVIPPSSRQANDPPGGYSGESKLQSSIPA